MPEPAVTTFTLNLSRRINAPRERVFRAWTTIEELKQWWGPDGFSLPVAEMDLRVGGAYHFAMQDPDGVISNLSGTFLEITPPQKLVYTWLWEGSPAESETRVTIEFRDLGTATDVIITHERFATAEDRSNHNDGWTGCIDRLMKLFP